jgi:hypothetical protein
MAARVELLDPTKSQVDALELRFLVGFATARDCRTASLLRLARAFFAAWAARLRIFLESLLSKLPIVSSRSITGRSQEYLGGSRHIAFC